MYDIEDYYGRGLAIMGAIGIILLVIILIDYVIRSIGNMILFRKMGISAGKAWIPVYADYLMYDGVYCQEIFWLTLIIGVISSAIAKIPVLPWILSLASLAVNVLYNSRKAKSFGGGVGQMLLLLLLGAVGHLIFAGISGEYVGHGYEAAGKGFFERTKNAVIDGFNELFRGKNLNENLDEVTDWNPQKAEDL